MHDQVTLSNHVAITFRLGPNFPKHCATHPKDINLTIELSILFPLASITNHSGHIRATSHDISLCHVSRRLPHWALWLSSKWNSDSMFFYLYVCDCYIFRNSSIKTIVK